MKPNSTMPSITKRCPAEGGRQEPTSPPAPGAPATGRGDGGDPGGHGREPVLLVTRVFVPVTLVREGSLAGPRSRPGTLFASPYPRCCGAQRGGVFPDRARRALQACRRSPISR